jgi:hypothetical protein
MSTLLAAAIATLVFCAPGYPGGAGDAQPYVDEFAKAAAAAAGWPHDSLAALYDPTEAGGLAKLKSADAALAFVPYPFFVQYGAELHLRPLVQADVVGTGPQERWTLVGKTGHASGAAALAGYTILSVAGYAPEFVRHAALGAFGLPADVKVEYTGQILSALRRVAAGEPVVALLDQTQAIALPTLPFAAQLQTVTESPALPVALLAVVDARLPAARVQSLQAALLKMGHGAAGAGAGAGTGASEALNSLRLQGFIPPQLPGH